MLVGKFDPEQVLASIDFNELEKHPNILLAAKFWDEDRYKAARKCYQFMRSIDDLIDDRKAEINSLNENDKKYISDRVNKWIGSLQEETSENVFFKEIAGIISKYNIPLVLFHNFARSMIYDIHNTGFPTFNSFLHYAEGASVAPASVFLHLCCLNEDLSEYANPSMELLSLARPCAIFSYLVHIIRDFQVDQRDNLNYFALDILRENKLVPEDLKSIARSDLVSDKFRNVVKTYYDLAEVYKQKTINAINELASHLRPQYLLSLKIIFRLYLEVYNRIDVAKGLFKTDELTPTPKEIKKIVSGVVSGADIVSMN